MGHEPPSRDGANSQNAFQALRMTGRRFSGSPSSAERTSTSNGGHGALCASSARRSCPSFERYTETVLSE
jgi:hypothetical protein